MVITHLKKILFLLFSFSIFPAGIGTQQKAQELKFKLKDYTNVYYNK